MAVLPLRWLLTRSRDLVPRERRTYPDLFFADPAAVEDDSRRMRPCARC
jgi:hypothetical protein